MTADITAVSDTVKSKDSCEVYSFPGIERHYYGKTLLWEHAVWLMFDKDGDYYRVYEKPTITNRLFREPEF
jgi:hypothetical protein